MATNEVPRGPVSEHAAENVHRLRERNGWTLADLAQRMREVGRPMLPSGLNRIENGRRRVDVDDLTALAAAFDVAPITLLLPWSGRGTVQLTNSVTIDAAAAWAWAHGSRPLKLPDGDRAADALVDFRKRAVPRAARDAGEAESVDTISRLVAAARNVINKSADDAERTKKLAFENAQLRAEVDRLRAELDDARRAVGVVGGVAEFEAALAKLPSIDSRSS